MDDTSEEQGPSQVLPDASFLPQDLIVGEILVRLPVKDVLRCRAVCRAWRHRTSTEDFLVAHHRRQPSLLLVRTHGEAVDVDAAFDALYLLGRPTELKPVLRINDCLQFSDLGDITDTLLPTVNSSCDGLILLTLDSHVGLFPRFYVCNPATRQWIRVPMPDRPEDLLGDDIRTRSVLGMYSHRPTGEYRVLSWEDSTTPQAVYYVHTLGSEEVRCIEQPIGSPSVQGFVESGPQFTTFFGGPAIFLQDCLYFLGMGRQGQTWQKGIVVFDTIKESFTRVLCLPSGAGQLQQNANVSWDWPYTGPVPKYDNISWDLFEIDGALAVCWGGRLQTAMKLWVLEDYETEAWSLKYQIEFSVVDLGFTVERPLFQGVIVSKDGDALVHCFNSSQLFHLDSKGKLVQTLHRDGLFPCTAGVRFKESLVRHAFFDGPREGALSLEPQFFVGL